MGLFGRRKRSAALEALKGASWRCASCGLDHVGMFDLAVFPGTRGQLCWMHPRDERQRPCLCLDDPDHPLALAQRDGITPERVLEIYAAYGHSSGPADS